MKLELAIIIFFITILQSCLPTRPKLTQDNLNLKTVIHSDTNKTGCMLCHEDKRPIANPAHGNNLDCNQCHHADLVINGKRTWSNVNKIEHSPNIQSCNKCHLTAIRDSRPTPKENHPTAKYNQLDCVVCHQHKAPNSSWKDIKFNHLSHTPAPSSCQQCHESIRPTSHTINPKTDAMKTTDCIACHGSTQNWKDQIKQFDHVKSNPQSCLECHKNDAPKPIENHPSKNEQFSKLDCVLCHTFKTSTPNEKKKWSTFVFNHKNHRPEVSSCLQCHNSAINSSLLANGSHQTGSRKNLDCNQCHVFAKGNKWTSFTTFNHTKPESSESCESCHNSNATTLKYKTATHVPTTLQCTECHSTNAWKPASFKHQSKDTLCLKCHDGKTASGRPSSHTLKTNAQCNVCHSQTRWSPAWYDSQYVHSQNGNLPPRQGRTHVDSGQCTSCHDRKTDSVQYKDNQYAPSCLGCHLREFNGEHRGSLSKRDCLRCHSYGTWDR